MQQYTYIDHTETSHFTDVSSLCFQLFNWIELDFQLSQLPLCSWSKRCNCKLLCTPRASSSEHIHAPKTQPPGAHPDISSDLQSHPKGKKGEYIFTDACFIGGNRNSGLTMTWALHYLTGVPPSLQIASTDHVFSDLKRICIKACVITQ